jgi:hypothetical protein
VSTMWDKAGNWATATAPTFLEIVSAAPQVITLAYETSGNMSVTGAAYGNGARSPAIGLPTTTRPALLRRANAEQFSHDGTVIGVRVQDVMGFWGQAMSVTVP